MDAATQACAPSGMTWHGINWTEVHRQVRRLQTRIVKATQEGRHNKVKALQWLLTHSFSGKALAVKRVTENQGKNTAGVDKITWKTPAAKTNAIASMQRRGYSPRPLRRVLIPKKNGKTRPLGIPTMKDCAMQALYLLSLEPIAETTADPNSWVQAGAFNSRCRRAMFYCAGSQKLSGMGAGGRHQRLFRQHQP